MPLLRTRKQLSGTCSSEAPTPTNGNGIEKSFAQARIERIVENPPFWDQSCRTWWRRMTADPQTFSDSALRTRLLTLETEIADLETDHWTEVLTSAEWLDADTRLRKIRGQRQAIRDVLQQRARRRELGLRVGPTPEPGLRLNTSGEAEVRDPFSGS